MYKNNKSDREKMSIFTKFFIEQSIRLKDVKPKEIPKFAELAKFLMDGNPKNGNKSVERWCKENKYDITYINNLLFQFAIYFSDFYTKGRSNEMKKKNKIYNENNLKIGTKVEMEHTTFEFIAEKIAKDHLSESTDYYKYLYEMEKKFLN